MDYGLGEQRGDATIGLTAQKESVREILEDRKKDYLCRISDIDEAISAMDKVPGILDILNALRKVGI